MSDLPTPITRKEQFLNSIARGNTSDLPTPITREEEYLNAIAKSGGGSGDGDMKKSVYDSDLAVANAGGIGAFVGNAVSGKVDKVEGKGLSTNDYSDTEKGKVAANTSAIEAIVNVTGAKNLCPFPSLSELKAINTSGTWNNNVYSYRGATFTVDETNKTISLEKSTQSAANFALFYLTKDIDFGDTLISTVSSEQQTANGWTISDGNNIATKTVNYGVTYDPIYDVDGHPVYVFIGGNQILSSVVIIKPMIRDARIKDPTYVPYAMTNRELTANVTWLKNKTFVAIQPGASFSYNVDENGYFVAINRQDNGGAIYYTSGNSVTRIAGADIVDQMISISSKIVTITNDVSWNIHATIF